MDVLRLAVRLPPDHQGTVASRVFRQTFGLHEHIQHT